MSDPLHVVAAALVGDDGRVLINQRLPGTPMAGRWEFPGGKVEPGEASRDAIVRELHEELGVEPTTFRPLMRIRHDYESRSVLLDCWRVSAWSGDIIAREGHPLVWVHPYSLGDYDLLEADRPLITALRLPDRYAITDDESGLPDPSVAPMVQLRGMAPGRVAKAVAAARDKGQIVLVNNAPEFAVATGADGVHLNASRLMALPARPLPAGLWVGASCHNEQELAHARAIGCDFAVLGPVLATPSHPGAEPLGWARFADLAAGAGLPVYALGGMSLADLETAWAHHAQGIAGIRAFS